ncbi:uncharacterized protein LOC125941367 [Dermacentor silvarum]|uniref:uncharacterized protein LOC125941367 n=1 Tax=Dermacentor silvarum TaxID=543639 RepID=UPI002100AC6E|nr:uncharacterized protein LOC125941367 [Dermacentor silvarum]
MGRLCPTPKFHPAVGHVAGEANPAAGLLHGEDQNLELIGSGAQRNVFATDWPATQAPADTQACGRHGSRASGATPLGRGVPVARYDACGHRRSDNRRRVRGGADYGPEAGGHTAHLRRGLHAIHQAVQGNHGLVGGSLPRLLPLRVWPLEEQVLGAPPY